MRNFTSTLVLNYDTKIVTKTLNIGVSLSCTHYTKLIHAENRKTKEERKMCIVNLNCYTYNIVCSQMYLC